MKNKFWLAFIQGVVSIFKFSPLKKTRIKNNDIDHYFIKAAHQINNAYEKVRDEQTH